MNLRLSDAERADLVAAAALTNETAAGYAARVTLAVARGQGDVRLDELEELRALLSELMVAHGALNRVGVLLNQAVTVLHSTGAEPPWLRRVVALVNDRVNDQDDVELRLGRYLERRIRKHRRPPPGSGSPRTDSGVQANP